MAWLLLVPIVLPILAGFGLLLWRPKQRRAREIYVLGFIILNAAISIVEMLTLMGQTFTFCHFTDKLELTLKVDGMSMIFGFIASILWIIATFYSLEYMKHEGKENKFFGFWTISFGVVLGVAFSANLITMYLFYEFLTMATLPLVMHAMDKKASSAGKKYVAYSITGASFGFIVIMILYNLGDSLNFVYGGVLSAEAIAGWEQFLFIAYLVAFLGFGIKAAIFPFFDWLPSAGVAPTPVSSLLHAVAVVNAGVFAVARVTYYSFGADFLRGSWAQYIAMGFVTVSIICGSSLALRTKHFKRRLAYSTMANLSYMLLGITLMTDEGLTGGLMHMLAHSIIKIVLFFVAGAVIYKTGKEHVDELYGIGKYMPLTFAGFTVMALGLIGLPPSMAFSSKFLIGTAAINSGNPMGYIGAAALMISALLTALYLFDVIIKAYFPRKDIDVVALNKDVHDPNWMMLGPILGLAAVSIIIGVWPQPFVSFFQMVAGGLI